MPIRHLTIQEIYTETEIQALTGQIVGDMFRPTDNPGVLYKADATGVPVLDADTDLVYVTNQQPNGLSPDSVPLSVASTVAGITTIDSSSSTFMEVATGAASGIHEYTFTGLKNTVDILGGLTPITLVAGTNVTITGNNAIKNIDGNTWNSAFSSAESYDGTVQDFAVSWEIEDIAGTIREMAGLDDAPLANNSYSSIEYAVYQVNSYFYSSVYEKGANIAIPGYATFYYQVGDRCGVRVENGKAIYFVLRGTTLTDIYTSLKPVTGPMYFKGAFNRGNTSSGASSMGNVAFHVAQKQTTSSIHIKGAATAPVSQEDIDNLKNDLGIEILPGSLYSNLQFNRPLSLKFDNGSGATYDINMTHTYLGMNNQEISILTF